MALETWLPLNGTLKNQGLSETSVTTSSAAQYVTGGKIGKAIALNSSSYLTFNYTGKQTQNFSISFWINIRSAMANTTDHMVLMRFQSIVPDGTTTTQSNFITWMNYHQIKFFNNKPQFVWVDPDYDKWVLFTVTSEVYGSNGYSVKLYKNGTLVKSAHGDSQFTLVNNSQFTIGYATSVGQFYLNDFRIYSHTLSPKEVSLLAQGLVCHIPMGNVDGKIGGKNLLNTANRLKILYSNNSTSYPTTYEKKEESGVEFYRIKRTQTDLNPTTLSLYNGIAKEAFPWSDMTGKTVTLSFKARTSHAATFNYMCFIYSGSTKQYFPDHNNKNNAITTSWKTYTSTIADFPDMTSMDGLRFCPQNFTIPNSITIDNFYLDVRDWKIEFGDTATPWTPAPEEATSFYSNTIYDTSGYNNNGTITDSTCPSWSSDSPRYQGCYKFDASKYISIGLQDTSGFANSYSISWWGNASAINSKMFWGFGDGNRLNLYCGWLCNTGDGQNNPFYKPGTTTNTTIPSVNVWHHYVMTGDGTTVKYYLDGVLYGTAKTYKPITGKTIYINGWNTATEYKIDGCISDFRVYATTLSADDVKELYQSVASISNTGVLAIHEFVEEEI